MRNSLALRRFFTCSCPRLAVITHFPEIVRKTGSQENRPGFSLFQQGAKIIETNSRIRFSVENAPQRLLRAHDDILPAEGAGSFGSAAVRRTALGTIQDNSR